MTNFLNFGLELPNCYRKVFLFVGSPDLVIRRHSVLVCSYAVSEENEEIVLENCLIFLLSHLMVDDGPISSGKSKGIKEMIRKWREISHIDLKVNRLTFPLLEYYNVWQSLSTIFPWLEERNLMVFTIMS